MRQVFCGAVLFASMALALCADEGGQAPPDRGVARVSVVNGEVSVRRGDSADVVAAAVNAPIAAADGLLTAASSRAEIQFDSSNMLRVGSNAEIRVADLQFRRYQVQVAIGTVTLRVLRPSDAQVEVDTPILGVHPLRPGVYRITVREDGSTEITVRDGEAEILTQRGTQPLNAGNTLYARGSVEEPEYRTAGAIGLDEWDNWNAGRDRDLLRSVSYQHVNRDVYGAEDLDPYGRWVNDEQYGQVWAPSVDPGWAPYQSGRWVWEDYYGWTWVSYDPWGWAPYHYGRWFRGSVGWCWYPGAAYGRHYWSPALVAFFGFGGYSGFHTGFGFGFGNVGWVPLAPFEPFQPWWGRGFYGGRTTIVNNFNLFGSYRNARVANGVTGVAASDFGRHTGRFTTLNGASIREAGLVRGVLPVTPDRASLRYGDRTVQASAQPHAAATRFYGRTGWAQPSQRVSFDQQRRNVEQVARTTFGGYNSPAVAQPNAGSHGWSRFGEPVQHSFNSAGAPQRGNYAPPPSQPTQRYESQSRNQPVRISPAIVHERSAPTVHERSAPAQPSRGGGDRGGGDRSGGRGRR